MLISRSNERLPCLLCPLCPLLDKLVRESTIRRRTNGPLRLSIDLLLNPPLPPRRRRPPPPRRTPSHWINSSPSSLESNPEKIDDHERIEIEMEIVLPDPIDPEMMIDEVPSKEERESLREPRSKLKDPHHPKMLISPHSTPRHKE
jgi:hypothetical protein